MHTFPCCNQVPLKVWKPASLTLKALKITQSNLGLLFHTYGCFLHKLSFIYIISSCVKREMKRGSGMKHQLSQQANRGSKLTLLLPNSNINIYTETLT